MGESLDQAPPPVSTQARQRPSVLVIGADTGAETAPGLVERFVETQHQPAIPAVEAVLRPAFPSGAFARAHAYVAAHEGGYQCNPADPGNWTGGKCNIGQLRGTNWGISAASYPDLDIRALTRDQAAALYKRDYWDRVRGDDLPPPLALLVYDFAVLAGVSRAAKTLQRVLGVAQDGAIGPATLAAVQRHAGRGADLCADYLAARLVFLTGLPTWRTFGAGWSRRLCALPFQAQRMGD